jgi:hypothetical protein
MLTSTFANSSNFSEFRGIFVPVPKLAKIQKNERLWVSREKLWASRTIMGNPTRLVGPPEALRDPYSFARENPAFAAQSFAPNLRIVLRFIPDVLRIPVTSRSGQDSAPTSDSNHIFFLWKRAIWPIF